MKAYITANLVAPPPERPNGGGGANGLPPYPLSAPDQDSGMMETLYIHHGNKITGRVAHV